MVDIHCHLLPGLDDGPDTLDEALQMAEMAIADGITHVIATPHANETYAFDPDLARQRRDELQRRLGARLALATGCDFHLSYENLKALEAGAARFTLNQKNYLLVEFADFAIPPTMDETLHRMHLAGLKPIITHPERNALIRSQPERLAAWLRMGCYVQVTALSLLGRFGESAKDFTLRLLDLDAIHFFASDAHSPTRRPLLLREAHDAVAQRRGHRYARAVFRENPLAAFEGRPLPYVPDLTEVDRALARKKKRRFRLF
jgi:protein-tyrosine phosphatase